MGRSFPWGIGAAVIVLIAAAAAWQAGWVRIGTTDRASPTNAAAPVIAPAPVVVPAPVAPTPSSAVASAPAASGPSQTDIETQRLRADAEALKKQLGAELARARADAEAVRAAKSKADAEAAGNKVRAQADADAARIRSEAQAAAARAKSDTEAAVREADTKVVKAAVATPSAAAGDARYDGTWNVTVDCEATPDGVLGFRREFDAQVKSGFLRGEQGIEGKPGWLRLQGTIQPDGNATLNAQGTTDNPKYSAGKVAAGTPFSYGVTAHFDANRGTGRRLQLRPCDLHFVKR
jgi:hypothetical protein